MQGLFSCRLVYAVVDQSSFEFRDRGFAPTSCDGVKPSKFVLL